MSSWKFLALVTALTLCASCASYHPEPLNGNDVATVLASPSRAALIASAQELQHPYLAPQLLDFSRPLPPAALAVIAVIANPELRALRAREHVTQAQAFAANLLPDPVLNLSADHVISPATESTAYAAGLTLDVLGALATRAVDRKLASAGAAQVRLDIAWQEWLTAGQAQLLATQLFYQEQAQTQANIARDLAHTAVLHMQAAAAAGDLSRSDAALARNTHADAALRASAAARDAQATRLALKRVLGWQPQEPLDIGPPDVLPAPAQTNGAPAAGPTTPTADAGSGSENTAESLFAAARRNRLDLRALAAGYAGREAALQRAVLGQYPRLTITLNRARDTSRVQTIGPGLSFDVPIWNRNRGALAVAGAERSAAATEYAARLYATRADIAALVAALQEDERGQAAVAAELALIEHTSDALAQAARRGDVTEATANALRATAVDKHLALIALQQSCAQQRLALRMAVGLPLVNTVSPLVDPVMPLAAAKHADLTAQSEAR